MSKIFCFDQATIKVAGKTVLTNVSLDIFQGRHLAITGDNGSGKTTLCKAIAGKYFISEGSAKRTNLQYKDIKLISFTDEGKLFHSVNNVHYYQQRFNSWDSDGFITVREYLISNGVNFEKGETDEFIKDLGLQDLLDMERIKLSSGQTRKLLLASAILSKPKLLIMDNPYIGLDADSRDFLNGFLEQLTLKSNITLILCGQFSILPKCIKEYVFVANETIQKKPSGVVNQKTLAFQEPLNNIKTQYEKLRRKDRNEVPDEYVNFSDINIKYGATSILEKFNWTIQKGDRWSLIGNNGSGKSTIISMIYADHPQMYSQQIHLFGRRFGAGRSIWDVKKEIGFTSPELHAYFRTKLTAEEVVWTGLFDKFEILGLVEDEIKKLSNSFFSYFNLEKKRACSYHSLSTGQQRICLFLRALIKSPVLLLLDEPFQGMDEINIELSRGLLDEILTADQALIFITHFSHELPSSINRHINLSNW